MGTRQNISALVGLAPYNDDSGTQSHTRHIRGGRGKVRTRSVPSRRRGHSPLPPDEGLLRSGSRNAAKPPKSP